MKTTAKTKNYCCGKTDNATYSMYLQISFLDALNFLFKSRKLLVEFSEYPSGVKVMSVFPLNGNGYISGTGVVDEFPQKG